MTEAEKKQVIREKISLLKDFCILRRSRDTRIQAVKDILSKCQSEIAMEQCLYEVLHGDQTIDNLISKKLKG